MSIVLRQSNSFGFEDKWYISLYIVAISEEEVVVVLGTIGLICFSQLNSYTITILISLQYKVDVVLLILACCQ